LANFGFLFRIVPIPFFACVDNWVFNVLRVK
jgi:hypothetical protein